MTAPLYSAADRMETIDGAFIQHGPASNRVYIMKSGKADLQTLLPRLLALAQSQGYTKIIAKIPVSRQSAFLEKGFAIEAEIPGFYNGKESALFPALFLHNTRKRMNDRPLQALRLAHARQHSGQETALAPHCRLRPCTPADAERMSGIYKTVFPSYPFPIHDPAYLVETMRAHVAYFAIETEGKLVALSSAEMEPESRSVEMTDFATLPPWRGQSFGSVLLAEMEKEMAAKGFQTAYTIARAVSPGMNITFAKKGYRFGGRLVNNTQISGQIESMNIWFKTLISKQVS